MKYETVTALKSYSKVELLCLFYEVAQVVALQAHEGKLTKSTLKYEDRLLNEISLRFEINDLDKQYLYERVNS